MKLAAKRDPIARLLGKAQDEPEPPRPIISRTATVRASKLDWHAKRTELAEYVAYHNGVLGRSVRDISNDFDVPHASFAYALRSLGIEYKRVRSINRATYTAKEKREMVSEMQVLKDGGMPYNAIAKRLGVGINTPRLWLKEAEHKGAVS